MITILYRACSKEVDTTELRKDRPVWFDKLKCFKSIHDAIQNCNKTKVELIVLMDGDENNSLSKYITDLNYKIIYNNFSSNNESLKHQLNYSKQINSDVIYFLEDDYLHTKNSLNILASGIQKYNLITGYDHLDRYTRTDDISYQNEIIEFYDTSHWRSVESTTCTWMCTKKYLEIVMPYAEYFMLNDRDLFRTLYQNNIRLYSPVPGVSTHVHKDFLSPGIDWCDLNNDIIKVAF